MKLPSVSSLKAICIVLFVFSFSVQIHAQSQLVSFRKYALKDFAFPLNASLAPPNHLWVMSGWSTVNPVSSTVMGVGECVGPPLAGKDFRMWVHIEANGHQVKDIGSTGKGDVGLLYSGGEWYPDRVIRKGTYHHLINNQLLSFSLQSELIPLFGKTGFLLKCTLTNRTTKPMQIRLSPEVKPGSPNVVPLNEWTYNQPQPGSKAGEERSDIWSNEKVAIQLLSEKLVYELPAQGSQTTYISIVFSQKNQLLERPVTLSQWETEARQVWENRLQWALQNVPVMETSIPGLEDYYKRSLVSGLVTLWENPAFVVNPFLTTCGIDGGGTCTYLWDFGGYIPRMATLLLGDKVIDNARVMTAIGLDKYYAYTLDGSGIGVPYSYSTWSYVNLVWTIFQQVGVQKVLFEEARRLVLENEKSASKSTLLIDYGLQHNLLEMRGTGWEHYVASPNAERVWCLERLADMGEKTGHKSTELKEWRKRAAAIRGAIQKELWDEKAGWFKSIYPGGHQEFTYTIQVYDAIRAGVCTPQMTEVLLSHLREGAFLFPYGVSSVSAEDNVHYEVNDTDWSGGGAYTGDGPDIALLMYELKRPELGWDILQRHFWMGRHLPYYPQEHYVDRPAVPAHKRANECSGLTGAEAILYGIAGLNHRLDGSLWVYPQPPKSGKITLRGYKVKGHSVDIVMENNTCQIVLDGKQLYSGQPKEIKIL